MVERGYVKLYRKKLDSDIWQYLHADRAFEFLMLSATYKPHKYFVYGTCIDLQPGQYVSSLRVMAQKCRLSLRELRTSLNYLKSTQRITQKATRQYSIFTIINWDCYQNSIDPIDTLFDTPIDTVATQDRHSSDTAATQKQEVIEFKELKEESQIRMPRTKTVRFIPPTYEEVAAYCKERNNTVDPIAFHSCYVTNGWKVGRAGHPMKDWKAAIVTWERRK